MVKADAPALVWTTGWRRHAGMQGYVPITPLANPDPQTLWAIKAMDSHEINLLSLTLNRNMDPFTTKARLVIGNLSDSHPQIFLLLIFGLVPA